MNKKIFYTQQLKDIPKQLKKHRIVTLYDYDNMKDLEVAFLSKKGLSKYREIHKIDTVKIIGYTKLKDFKDTKDAILVVPCLTQNPINMDMNFSKKSFHRNIGYIPVANELNKDFQHNSNLFVAVERLAIIPIILLPIILFLFFLLCFHSCNNYDKSPDNHQPVIEKNVSDTTSDYEYEPNARPGGELPTGYNTIASTDSIEAALYDANKIYLSKDNQTIDLLNPAGNTVDFQYFIYSNESKTDILFSSKMIAPSKYIKWNAYDICKSGETTLYITVKTFDVDSHKECNSYTTKMYIVK